MSEGHRDNHPAAAACARQNATIIASQAFLRTVERDFLGPDFQFYTVRQPNTADDRRALPAGLFVSTKSRRKCKVFKRH